LEAAQVPVNSIWFEGTVSRQNHPFVERVSDGGSADINIVCVNPDQFAAFAAKVGPQFFHGRYTIGVWFWEVEDFPSGFHGAFRYVDEIWVATDFMRETFLKVSPKRVFKYTLPILVPKIDRSLTRSDLRLPDGFLFLFSFDFLSVLERKNPVGLIEAFRRAFSPGEGPVLVIKTINGEKRTLEMEKLRYAARNRADIVLIDGYLSPIETGTLTALADCYVSLHRAEGFGLTIAEAMALGKPAIATAYSGNLEFMTADNSYLVPFRRSIVGPEREPYPADSHWSEPDLEQAIILLRHVYGHHDEARSRGSRAAEDIRAAHSPEVAGAIIRDRLAKIRDRRANPRPFRSVAFFEERLEELERQNSD
jgi:glycosyltransferase involved in cell wall biosynthesis